MKTQTVSPLNPSSSVESKALTDKCGTSTATQNASVSALKPTRTEAAMVKAGYRIIRAVSTRERLTDRWITDSRGNVVPGLRGPKQTGRWFEVETPDGQPALLLRQGPHCWHVFGASCWTASGSSVESAHRGGLGDAIGTDSQMATYSRLVRRAPETLADKYSGLNAAKQQVYNDRM